jgi:hypothetical protein
VGGRTVVEYRSEGGPLLGQQAITNDESRQILALERENARLQRLVAELLAKNEQLRQMCSASSTAADG